MQVGDRELPYLLKRSAKRRRVVLTVDERGLVVHVPWRASEQHIARVIADSESWIVRKVAEWDGRKAPERTWVSGELLDFLGRQLTLHLVACEGRPIAQLKDGSALELSLSLPHDPSRVREAVVQWYRRHANSHFSERVQYFCAKLDLPSPRVLLSSARTRWGSCNATREIRLNWRLLQAASHVIDYVVAHEVAHLEVPSHSVRFWRLVQRLYPDYEAAKAELNAMSRHYMAL